jgi:molybdenum cofactor biosynthesis enzyme
LKVDIAFEEVESKAHPSSASEAAGPNSEADGRLGREVLVSASATASGQTGVEMEALAAATFAALNLIASASSPQLTQLSAASRQSLPLSSDVLFDGRLIEVFLQSKTGGKSGDYAHDRYAFVEARGDLATWLILPLQGDACPMNNNSVHRSGLADVFIENIGSGPGSGCFHKKSSVATTSLHMPATTWRKLVDNVNKKGNVLGVSQLAGELAADQARKGNWRRII